MSQKRDGVKVEAASLPEADQPMAERLALLWRSARGRPLALLSVAFAAGVAAAYRISPGLIVALMGLVAALLIRFALPVRFRLAAWLAVFFFAGAARFVQDEKPGGQSVTKLSGRAATIVGRVHNRPLPWGAGRFTFVLRVEKQVKERGDSPLRGRLYVRTPAFGPVEQGDRVQVTGIVRIPGPPTNPGQPSPALRARLMGFDGYLNVGHPGLIRKLPGGQLPFSSALLFRARERVARFLENGFQPPYSSLSGRLLASLLFGLRASPLPQAIVEVFRKTGTIHLLVVSGSQISLLFAFIYLPAAVAAAVRRRAAGGGWSAGAGMRPLPGLFAGLTFCLLIGGYSLFAEGGSPVVRAALIGLLAGIALLLRQIPAVAERHPLQADASTLLGAAALIILIYKPVTLLEPGFQMSFAAVLGLIWLAPRAAALMTPLPRILRWTAACTFGAQLAVIPLVAWHYGHASLPGFVGNVYSVPIVAALLTMGLPACAVGSFWPAAGEGVLRLSKPLLWWLVQGTVAMSRLPGSEVEWRLRSLPEGAAYYGSLVVLGLGMERAAEWLRRKRTWEVGPSKPSP
jgi:competence protein ComEC